MNLDSMARTTAGDKSEEERGSFLVLSMLLEKGGGAHVFSLPLYAPPSVLLLSPPFSECWREIAFKPEISLFPLSSS